MLFKTNCWLFCEDTPFLSAEHPVYTLIGRSFMLHKTYIMKVSWFCIIVQFFFFSYICSIIHFVRLSICVLCYLWMLLLSSFFHNFTFLSIIQSRTMSVCLFVPGFGILLPLLKCPQRPLGAKPLVIIHFNTYMKD